jgi:hypothetical protein
MDLNPKRGRMKRKFIKSSFRMPLLENDQETINISGDLF